MPGRQEEGGTAAAAGAMSRADRGRVARSFEQFVAEHTGLLRKYMAGQLSGAANVSLEDALQEGLVRIWKEWDSWPADAEQRLRYAQRALKCAAIDAVRRQYGRDGTRPQDVAVDFALAEAGGAVEGGRITDTTLAALGLALAEQAHERRYDTRLVERNVLVAALVALKPLERRVVWELAHEGRSHKELADELGITAMKVRDTFFEARALLRTLIAHADGSDVPRKERARLFALLDGELRGRERRMAQRHLDHCPACQRLATIEHNVTAAGAYVFGPLPLVLAAIGDPARFLLPGASSSTAAVAGGATSATAAGGATSAAAAGFAPAAVSPAVTVAAHGLAGAAGALGAKFAIAVTALTLATSAGAAAWLSELREQPDAGAAAAPVPVSGPRGVVEAPRTGAVRVVSLAEQEAAAERRERARARAEREREQRARARRAAAAKRRAAARRRAAQTAPAPAAAPAPAPAASAVPATARPGGGAGTTAGGGGGACTGGEFTPGSGC